MAGAGSVCSCGDGSAAPESLPSWADSEQTAAQPVWLRAVSELASSWQYDASGQPRAAAVGSASDGITDAPASTGGTGSPGFPSAAGSAGPITGAGLNLVVGCDVRARVSAGDITVSSRACVNFFSNLNPALLASMTVEQTCLQFTTEGSPLTFTALPNGCDQSMAIGECTRSQSLGSGIMARFVYYYYDGTYDSHGRLEGEVCRRLR